MALESKTVTVTGELAERSAVVIVCPECNERMEFDGGTWRFDCGCGYVWQWQIVATGTKWVRDGNQ